MAMDIFAFKKSLFLWFTSTLHFASMDIFLEGFEIEKKMPISDWKKAKVPEKFFKVFFKNVKAFRCKRQGVLGETPWRFLRYPKRCTTNRHFSPLKIKRHDDSERVKTGCFQWKEFNKQSLKYRKKCTAIELFRMRNVFDWQTAQGTKREVIV